MPSSLSAVLAALLGPAASSPVPRIALLRSPSSDLSLAGVTTVALDDDLDAFDAVVVLYDAESAVDKVQELACLHPDAASRVRAVLVDMNSVQSALRAKMILRIAVEVKARCREAEHAKIAVKEFTTEKELVELLESIVREVERDYFEKEMDKARILADEQRKKLEKELEEVSSQIAVKKMLSVIFWAVFVLAVICLGSFIGMLALAQVKLVSRIVIFSPQILEDCTNFCYSLFTVEIFLMSYGVALISLFAISLCFALAEAFRLILVRRFDGIDKKRYILSHQIRYLDRIMHPSGNLSKLYFELASS